VRRLLLRGRAHKILREFGLLSINRVTAAEAGAKKPRRKDGRRQEKSIHVEDKMIHRPNGSSTRVRLYAEEGRSGSVSSPIAVTSPSSLCDACVPTGTGTRTVCTAGTTTTACRFPTEAGP